MMVNTLMVGAYKSFLVGTSISFLFNVHPRHPPSPPHGFLPTLFYGENHNFAVIVVIKRKLSKAISGRLFVILPKLCCSARYMHFRMGWEYELNIEQGATRKCFFPLYTWKYRDMGFQFHSHFSISSSCLIFAENLKLMELSSVVVARILLHIYLLFARNSTFTMKSITIIHIQSAIELGLQLLGDKDC